MLKCLLNILCIIFNHEKTQLDSNPTLQSRNGITIPGCQTPDASVLLLADIEIPLPTIRCTFDSTGRLWFTFKNVIVFHLIENLVIFDIFRFFSVFKIICLKMYIFIAFHSLPKINPHVCAHTPTPNEHLLVQSALVQRVSKWNGMRDPHIMGPGSAPSSNKKKKKATKNLIEMPEFHSRTFARAPSIISHKF